MPRVSRPAFLRFLREWILGVLLPVWLVATFLVMIARIDGDSMLPTLRDGERYLLLKWPRWLHTWGLNPDWPARGDIIVFRGPADHPESYDTGWFGLRYRPYLVKRVVGIPGDRVEIREGVLWRNGTRVAESSVSGEAAQDEAPVVVPRQHVYVLGDNRRLGESIDSRYFGPVSLRDVAGTLGIRLLSAPTR